MRRNGTMDIARLVAAWGIVAFHAGGPGAAIGYAGLPFFLILLIVFAEPATRDMDLRTFVRGRAHRLLLLWLIWSAVYGGLKLLEAAVAGRPLSEEFDAAMILTGPALHLWFLPFAFAVSLALYPVLRSAGTGAGDAACAVAVPAGLALTALQQDLTMPAPLAQWLFAAPAICVGLTLALCRERILLQGAICAAVAGSALAAGWTAGAATGHRGRSLRAVQPLPQAADGPVTVGRRSGDGRLSGPSAVPIGPGPRHAAGRGVGWTDAGGLPLRHPAGQPAGPPDRVRPAVDPHRAFRSGGNCGPVNSLLTGRKASIHPPELAM